MLQPSSGNFSRAHICAGQTQNTLFTDEKFSAILTSLLDSLIRDLDSISMEIREVDDVSVVPAFARYDNLPGDEGKDLTEIIGGIGPYFSYILNKYNWFENQNDSPLFEISSSL